MYEFNSRSQARRAVTKLLARIADHDPVVTLVVVEEGDPGARQLSPDVDVDDLEEVGYDAAVRADWEEFENARDRLQEMCLDASDLCRAYDLGPLSRHVERAGGG